MDNDELLGRLQLFAADVAFLLATELPNMSRYGQEIVQSLEMHFVEDGE